MRYKEHARNSVRHIEQVKLENGLDDEAFKEGVANIVYQLQCGMLPSFHHNTYFQKESDGKAPRRKMRPGLQSLFDAVPIETKAGDATSPTQTSTTTTIESGTDATVEFNEEAKSQSSYADDHDHSVSRSLSNKTRSNAELKISGTATNTSEGNESSELSPKSSSLSLPGMLY